MGYLRRSEGRWSPSFMSNTFLKHWLHDPNLSPSMKLLAILSTFEEAVPLSKVLMRGEEAGVKRRVWSNPSSTLARTTEPHRIWCIGIRGHPYFRAGLQRVEVGRPALRAGRINA